MTPEQREKQRVLRGLQELNAAEKGYSAENEGGIYWLHRRLDQWIDEYEYERHDCCTKCRTIDYQLNTCTGDDCECHLATL